MCDRAGRARGLNSQGRGGDVGEKRGWRSILTGGRRVIDRASYQPPRRKHRTEYFPTTAPGCCSQSFYNSPLFSVHVILGCNTREFIEPPRWIAGMRFGAVEFYTLERVSESAIFQNRSITTRDQSRGSGSATNVYLIRAYLIRAEHARFVRASIFNASSTRSGFRFNKKKKKKKEQNTRRSRLICGGGISGVIRWGLLPSWRLLLSSRRAFSARSCFSHW